jgi:hypothetical protein|nr:hypothetical protein [Phenylobacterium sp.]
MSFIQYAKRLALGCAAALLLGAPAWAQAHDGDWAGSLKTPSGQELHLILHVTTKAGETDAVLDSVDQGATIPAAAYKADGDKVSILFLAVGGEMEGEFAPDGKTFTGTWKQGATMPLTLTRKAPAAK